MSDFYNNLRINLIFASYFPLLSVLGFIVVAICSIPYAILSCVWVVCFPILLITSLIPSDIYSKEIIKNGILSFIFPVTLSFAFFYYFIIYILSLFTFPLWLLLGLIIPELVIPDELPASRSLVLFTYLIMPILSIAMISVG